jgi:hypothetical protein
MWQAGCGRVLRICFGILLYIITRNEIQELFILQS